MKNKKLFQNTLNNLEFSEFNKKVKIFKDTKWVSFGTYIMTVEGFGYSEGSQSYIPILNTFEYQSDTYVIKLSYNDEKYFIESKELYKSVSVGDRIVVTIKYSYDKDDTLINSNIHHFHPYPLTDN